MNKKALHTLEYHKIIDMLTECATSASGKTLCQNLAPSVSLAEIQLAQQQTSDALTRIYQKGSLSFSGIHNIGASLKRLEVGGALSIGEFLKIASLLEVAKRAKAYSRSEREDTKADSLDDYFSRLEPLSPLLEEIRRCILSEDEIADDASSALKNIRRSIKNTNEKIRSQMNDLLNSNRTHLQDAVITMRGGRYCLPVKAESKGQVPGMIHDQSSTGSTLFIEPMAIVKLNNDLKELYLKEQEEIEVILANLSSLTGEYIPYLQDDYEILTELDFIFAKGSLARKYNGTAPIFNEEHRIRIRKGRHPLLDSRKVVPIDIHLGEEFDLLIVTGPNTGGKTVSLKTVGLFTLMGQAGLHIPANDRSELSIFEEVFADIGDEQSIEQNLSTFSSHMVNTVSILEKADENCLALFDELGAGTDPVEGAALATSILSNLHQRGSIVMATTHYSELKLYALQTPDVENACCEFDVTTLRPTYRLLIGVPGKSNAFAISQRLGLSADIIEDAKNRVTSDAKAFEDVLTDLEATRIKLEQEHATIAKNHKEISELKKQLREKNEKLENSKERILANANAEASRILSEAKEYADETIRKYTKWAKSDAHIREMEAERAKLREQIHDKDSRQQAAPKKTAKKINTAELMVGSDVRILPLNSVGTVSTLPNEKGELFVQAGLLRTKVKLSDIELIKQPKSKPEPKKKSGSGHIRMDKASNIHQEINLIGMTVDEAMIALGKYLDDAYLAHLAQVTVIHGRGTGALRKAVHGHLKRTKYVKSFRLGEFGEGDMGVTIVEFH